MSINLGPEQRHAEGEQGLGGCNGPNECISVHTSCTKGEVLEGVASANVLQFLRDLRWRPVQLFCHTFLLMRVHAVELLT